MNADHDLPVAPAFVIGIVTDGIETLIQGISLDKSGAIFRGGIRKAGFTHKTDIDRAE